MGITTRLCKGRTAVLLWTTAAAAAATFHCCWYPGVIVVAATPWMAENPHQQLQQDQRRFLFGLQQRGGATKATTTTTTTTTTTSLESAQQDCSAAPNMEKKEKDDSTMGGGAVNEKVRLYGKQQRHDTRNSSNVVAADATSLYNPINFVSHALHTLVGLDRYPNYLNRWSMHDIDKLEESLQLQLEKVRKERLLIQTRRNDMGQLVQAFLQKDNNESESQSDDRQQRRLFQPPTHWDDLWKRQILHPQAQKAIVQSKMMKSGNATQSPPSLQDVLSGKTLLELDASQLEDWIDEECFDVYSFPLLSKEFCQELRSTLQELVAWSHYANDGAQQQQQLPELGAGNLDLDTLGLSWLSDLLLGVILRPIARHLYRESELQGGELDWRQAYVAGYSATPSSLRGTPRQSLVSHTDDSEVTLNVCLARPEVDFQGGALQFWGLRQESLSSSSPLLLGEYTPPQLGWAVIHAGRHLHQVTPVTRGERFVCILWARSWRHVRSQQCPCCWLNRRDADGSKGTCICGAQWN